ncbi:MAG: hypothetical protein QMD53_04685 [Actinomycetota bacterium]|nr:hypothetical protein [Actinomycetota bacterium]
MSPNKEDTYSHKGWLVSDFFIKRAPAVHGYYLVGGLIIAGAIIFLMILMGIALFLVFNSAFRGF